MSTLLSSRPLCEHSVSQELVWTFSNADFLLKLCEFIFLAEHMDVFKYWHWKIQFQIKILTLKNSKNKLRMLDTPLPSVFLMAVQCSVHANVYGYWQEGSIGANFFKYSNCFQMFKRSNIFQMFKYSNANTYGYFQKWSICATFFSQYSNATIAKVSTKWNDSNF